MGAGAAWIEVVAYTGGLLALVGPYVFYGRQYSQLGSGGHLVVLALVAAAAAIAAYLLGTRQANAPLRRAYAAALTLAVVSTCAFVAQLQWEQIGAGQVTGDLWSRIALVTALTGALLAGAFLARTGAGLLALAFAVSTCAAALSANLWLHVRDAWELEAGLVLTGAVLVAAAEANRLLHRRWAAEILCFAGVLVPVCAAFPLAGDGRLLMELLAGGAAGLAFVASVQRRSAGYALAGGIGLFKFLLDIEVRYFRDSLGFALILITSGLALLGIAYALARILSNLDSKPLGKGAA